jgi:LPS-assembly lipoprotein
VTAFIDRRRFVIRAAVTLAGAALGATIAGCGFELRRAPELRFHTIQLAGFRQRSPLADELRASINASTTTVVVEALAQAQVVLEAIEDVRGKVVVASSAVGQVTEFQLRNRFTFRLRSVTGRELIPRTEILLTRDMSYTESAALGKEQEEDFLYARMQNDIVLQVLRRLASIQTF